MIRVEPIRPHATPVLPATNDTTDAQATRQLRDAVTLSVRAYLDELDGYHATDIYQMVLAEIEAPLLEEIMAYTRNNQTKASLMLGLNRGTLRKKLKQYNLISERD
ncbi:MAG: DNA-binding transcriptional regulator Fis [Halioglobus sp.]|nr:DNA-binding transcriptional regulator Fis [Halioglobus sp.]